MIQREGERIVRNSANETLVILGDFNAHLEILKHKKNNINGSMVMKWLDKLDLTLLNADEMCEGTYTWSRGEQKSALDLVLVNRKMYEVCDRMVVDEGKEEINFSDHSMVTVELGLRCRGGGGSHLGRV